MSIATTPNGTALGGIRTLFAVPGVLAIVVGLLILVWPGKTAEVVTAIIAVYAIVAGLAYGGSALFSRSISGWARGGYIALGVAFVIAGVLAFANLGLTAATLAVFVGGMVGIVWIVEGVVALTTLSTAVSRGWSVFYAIVSIIAGGTLLFSPLWGAVVLWWLLGIWLVVLGGMQIARAVTVGGDV